MISTVNTAQFRVSQSLNLSTSTIKKIAVKTTGQGQNPLWMKMRKNRLTASMFGKVLHAVERESVGQTAAVIDMITGTTSVPRVPAICWGIEHEKKAIETYCRLVNKIVKETGLWVFPNGFLAASPDGIVFDPKVSTEQPEGIIEVKCPYYAREHTFSELEQMDKWPKYLLENGSLKPGTDYYHQVQGELYATGATLCDFVVWTPRDIHITRVYPSEVWIKNDFSKLVDFYLENLLTRNLDLLTLEGILFFSYFLLSFHFRLQ